MYILVLLNFTPLEFETLLKLNIKSRMVHVKFYSVGVWNNGNDINAQMVEKLNFTPLEFETMADVC